MVDIVIVSYKDELELNQCIKSIKEHCVDYNLIIEDNNISNIGFTRAVNVGIKKGSADWVWLLNSDALIKDNMTQQALINRFSYGSQVGLVGSMQIDPYNHDLIKFAGSDCCFPAGRHKGGLLSMGHGRIPEKQKWLNFASVMLRRSMTNKIGLLDESMFLVYSDSSYCYTARSLGYECWYEPCSQVFHKLKASKGGSDWHRKDMEAFMKKWGITYDETSKSFQYSPLFQKLDMFP